MRQAVAIHLDQKWKHAGGKLRGTSHIAGNWRAWRVRSILGVLKIYMQTTSKPFTAVTSRLAIIDRLPPGPVAQHPASQISSRSVI
jgi:hypothetical protein